MSDTTNPQFEFWQGNQALAEGALAAGCRFFAGYPITPASEIAEVMSKKLPPIGGVYLQMEDEIAAISAVIGASWGGLLSMTATSGPGFSLMQESIGYAIMTETPCVVVDVQRAGPSTGQATKVAQGDFMQSRWGTHGDHESIVLAPYSAQESFELVVRAFSISEHLRHPVIILSDEIVAHSRERVLLDDESQWKVTRHFAKGNDGPYDAWTTEGKALMPRFGDGKELLVTGSTHDIQGFRKTSSPEIHDQLVRRLSSKIRENKRMLTDVIIQGPESAEWGVISFGSTGRAVEEAFVESKKRFKSLRLRTVWPFPDEVVRRFADSVQRILVPELNLGQLVNEVSRVSGDNMEIVSLNRIGGGRLIEPEEIVDVVCGR